MSADLEPLKTEINDTIGVMQSAEVALNGVAAKISAAIAQALSNGATAAELAPVIDLGNSLKAEATSLAQAVANQPA
jgi:hypothetical protein